jgi:hypothetical protein
MIKKGHWVLLPASDVLDTEELRLSPLGVVPQRERRPRTISDYSYFGVNDETLNLAPPEAMQFGKALQRILQTVHDANPRFGPVHLSTVDIADGFYRMNLRPQDALRLGVLFPSRPGERQLIGIPLVLPMGWTESPPAFCAATETVADLANNTMASDWKSLDTPHRLDEVAESPIPPDDETAHDTVPEGLDDTADGRNAVRRRKQKPTRSWDIYVDDFLGVAQGNRKTLKKVKRALLNSLDKVFRPLSPSDNPERQEPASIKKFLKGNGTWSTKKRMLGWDIDTVAKTIRLPPHRVERLFEILDSIKPYHRTVSTKQWHKVLGELRSMTLAIPGSKGLFSILQEAFRHEENERLQLSPAVHGILRDFRKLALDLSRRPTRIAELVPSEPVVLGACDAAGVGMGGVFFVPDAQTGTVIPHLWRETFPSDIQAELVSFDNPHGSINNSELELAGNIAQHAIVADTADVRERTISTLSDNTASVYWLRKGSTTTTGPPAYLLRLQAHHQRHHRYLPRHDYIPGTANTMADLCSRAWHLSDSQLLAHFDQHYPQTTYWRKCVLPTPMRTALISALRRKPYALASIPRKQTRRMPIGSFGFNSAPNTTSTLSLLTSKTQSSILPSSPNDIVTGDWPPSVNPSHLSTFVRWCARLRRRSSGWGPRTPEFRN